MKPYRAFLLDKTPKRTENKSLMPDLLDAV